MDLAFLSFAQVDEQGNVNVSKFGSKLPGCGGFIDISQNAKRVVFCGLFRRTGDVRIEDGMVRMIRSSGLTKFPGKVEQITFDAERARLRRQSVLYVTERAVFGLGSRGVELLEIAPGCNLERDVLPGMAFRPEISASLRVMDAAVFRPGPLHLAERWAARSGTG